MAKAEEGKFDAFGPENVAPLVAFLASDEAADVNGQNFVVFGGSVWVMQGWQPAGQLKRDSAVDAQGAGRQQVHALRHPRLGPAALQLLLIPPPGGAQSPRRGRGASAALTPGSKPRLGRGSRRECRAPSRRRSRSPGSRGAVPDGNVRYGGGDPVNLWQPDGERRTDSKGEAHKMLGLYAHKAVSRDPAPGTTPDDARGRRRRRGGPLVWAWRRAAARPAATTTTVRSTPPRRRPTSPPLQHPVPPLQRGPWLPKIAVIQDGKSLASRHAARPWPRPRPARPRAPRSTA